jgi:SWI/SNF-related matrix-associated actin-dependent regulator of chromatin subfamily A3
MKCRHVAKDSISVYRYHGPNRIRDPTKLREFDIILTSYHTVTHECSKGNNVFGRLNFFRVVLDEGMDTDIRCLFL